MMTWVFWIAAALIADAYLGYPVWLWFRSWWSPRPVLRGLVEPTVSAAMIVRNEESVIAAKLDNLFALDYPAEKLEIVVVSDGSEDGTVGILEGLQKNPRVRVLLKDSVAGQGGGLE